jgi:hypothetical protein
MLRGKDKRISGFQDLRISGSGDLTISGFAESNEFEDLELALNFTAPSNDQR